MQYRNPIIPGFYPDPSVCCVGNDYYLVTSSFEYFPGVPVFHSRDLVNWRQIGHCLTRRSQLDMAGLEDSSGIWAPTIRHHAGRFYMITTLVRRQPNWNAMNFYVHTDNPAGEWSEPVVLERGNIDPDLFFDDDGTCYFTSNGSGEITTRKIDIETGRMLSDDTLLWTGTGGPYPEAPHIYKRDGRYYLMIAEGGTEYTHMITIARGDSLTECLKGLDQNPILTHYFLEDHPIQCTGHGDLVTDPQGNWWIVFLATRPEIEDGDPYQVMGRETFLAPVTWNRDGWPVINRGRPIELEMTGPGAEVSGQRVTTEGFDWVTLRTPKPDCCLVDSKAQTVTLTPTGSDLASVDDEASVVMRRQTSKHARFNAVLEQIGSHESLRAGLVVWMNSMNHYLLEVVREGGSTSLVVKAVANGVTTNVTQRPLTGDRVKLAVRSGPRQYGFHVNDESEPVSVLDFKPLSQEVAGGFTGVMFGLYALGVGESGRVNFSQVEYVSR